MTAKRPTYLLIGDPVHHSRSPAMYDAAFRYLGIDATYVARRVPGGNDCRPGS